MTEPKTCGMPPKILIVASTPAFAGDRNYQLARMALAVAVDARPTVLLWGAARPLGFVGHSLIHPMPDFYEQERFLREMEIPIFVVAQEGVDFDARKKALRDGVQLCARERLASLFAGADQILWL